MTARLADVETRTHNLAVAANETALVRAVPEVDTRQTSGEADPDTVPRFQVEPERLPVRLVD